MSFTGFHQTYLCQPNIPLHIIHAANFGTIKNDLDASFPSLDMAPTKPMHAPEDFQFFKKLPLELQIKVWKLAVNDILARVVLLCALIKPIFRVFSRHASPRGLNRRRSSDSASAELMVSDLGKLQTG